MLRVDLDKKSGIVTLSPDSALSEGDFKKASAAIDPYIEEAGKLQGLIIYTQSFPGWKSFGAFLGHLHFVREHHKQILRVALMTDSAVANLGEKLASHFISAEIKHFQFSRMEEAKHWISKDLSA